LTRLDAQYLTQLKFSSNVDSTVHALRLASDHPRVRRAHGQRCQAGLLLSVVNFVTVVDDSNNTNHCPRRLTPITARWRTSRRIDLRAGRLAAPGR
jgi:hypothetical protein